MRFLQLDLGSKGGVIGALAALVVLSCYYLQSILPWTFASVPLLYLGSVYVYTSIPISVLVAVICFTIDCGSGIGLTLVILGNILYVSIGAVIGATIYRFIKK